MTKSYEEILSDSKVAPDGIIEELLASDGATSSDELSFDTITKEFGQTLKSDVSTDSGSAEHAEEYSPIIPQSSRL